ncbi:MAG: hypothetical protein J6T10_22550 [Methanobrevibacter sp.]|nr:hypothetical protein [Methanobrevibacter sp.]
METRLANDIVNQLQTEIHYLENEKNGVYGDTKLWERSWSAKCWFKFSKVIIGNDEYFVTALRSYDTVVGFILDDTLYEVGKYSRTTSKQITRYFMKLKKDLKRVYFDKIRG